ncbi:MAG: tetratricopeptide repeat protein [Acidobacteria bacterium]|nr:tetratricopeptide repeat protein [Acidobacteriota bacterium]
MQTAGWLVVACLMWMIGAPAHAKNTLICTITDETGKPHSKEQIYLVADGSDKEKKEKTNDAGLVQFKGLDDGTYRMYALIENYVVSKSAPIALSGNAVVQDCKFAIVATSYANSLMQEVMELVKQKKYPEAEQKGQKTVELLPGEAGAHYVLALSRASLGKEAEAVTAIKTAAELSPEKFKDVVTPVQLMALDTQAKEAIEKGNFDLAMQKYGAMEKVAPNDPTIFYNMAIAYGRQSKFDEAVKAIDKAIALKPEDAEFHQTKNRLLDLQMKTLDQKLELK